MNSVMWFWRSDMELKDIIAQYDESKEEKIVKKRPKNNAELSGALLLHAALSAGLRRLAQVSF